MEKCVEWQDKVDALSDEQASEPYTSHPNFACWRQAFYTASEVPLSGKEALCSAAHHALSCAVTILCRECGRHGKNGNAHCQTDHR